MDMGHVPVHSAEIKRSGHATRGELLKYRADIDGLRTLAVLPVLLYHLDVPPFSGGFVGVDIFFVISGFLITSVIWAQLQTGVGLGGLLVGFYDRRLRRIFPALAVVLAFTVAVGSWLLLPLDLRDLGRSTMATSLFVSNIYFWLVAGYFDAPAHMKPLLHTWSLAVEEQFYIVFPFVAFLLHRLSRAKVLTVLGLLAVVSFAISVRLTYTAPTSAFYLPQSRAWELLLGALLAVAPRLPGMRTTREIAGVLGLALVAGSFFVINLSWPFPGATALAPCVGAGLIIYAGMEGSTSVGRLLSTAPMVWVGKRSYSLYLWHWPLIVFARYWLVRDLNLGEAAVVGGLALLASDLSLRWIEAPFRRSGVGRSIVFGLAGAGVTVFVGIGFIGHATNGMPQRFPTLGVPPGPEAYTACLILEPKTFREWSPRSCTFSGPTAQAPLVALWGDSYAAHYLPGLRTLQAHDHFTIVQLTSAGCSPFLSHDEAKSPDCREFGADSAAWIMVHRPQLVILAARWNRYRDPREAAEELGRSLAKLRAAHIPVLVIGESPVFGGPVPQILNMLARRGRTTDRLTPLNAFLTDPPVETVSRANRAAFFSPRKALCSANGCLLAVDGQPVHWDEGHLSVAGSVFLASKMESQLRTLLPAMATPPLGAPPAKPMRDLQTSKLTP